MSCQSSFTLRWNKRRSISWHSIESDSSPWWWALPFLYVTSSGVLRVALSRLVILPRQIVPQFQSPEQMNDIFDVEIHSSKCVRVEHQVTSAYPLTLRSPSISHHWSDIKKSHLLFIKPARTELITSIFILWSHIPNRSTNQIVGKFWEIR